MAEIHKHTFIKWNITTKNKNFFSYSIALLLFNRNTHFHTCIQNVATTKEKNVPYKFYTTARLLIETTLTTTCTQSNWIVITSLLDWMEKANVRFGNSRHERRQCWRRSVGKPTKTIFFPLLFICIMACTGTRTHVMMR